MTSTTRQTHQPVPRGPAARVAIVAGSSRGMRAKFLRRIQPGGLSAAHDHAAPAEEVSRAA
jgi:hypothetical protein